jgi:hypothetical protein
MGSLPNLAILVGIGHRSDHGKDTLANMMVEWFDLNHRAWKVLKKPWAWKGKEICHQLYGWAGLREPDFYETDEGRKARNVKIPALNMTPVEIWIKVLSRGIRDQCWDRTWVEWLKNSPTSSRVLIPPDTRFPLEVPYCTYTIKCTNPRIPNRVGLSVDDELAGYDDWTFYLSNDGTLDDLRRKAYRLCQVIADGLLNDVPAHVYRGRGRNRF